MLALGLTGQVGVWLRLVAELVRDVYSRTFGLFLKTGAIGANRASVHTVIWTDSEAENSQAACSAFIRLWWIWNIFFK